MDDDYDDDMLERESGDEEVATSLVPEGADGTDERQYLRPENEDDDGYDPYSDRRDERPMFEPDPWD